MQDGASPHTAKDTIKFLTKYFGERVISYKSTNIWPPYSPDMNPCDFFLWGYLKDKVFTENPVSCNDIKNHATKICSSITIETCKKVINNLSIRLRCCVTKNGKHFCNILKP